MVNFPFQKTENREVYQYHEVFASVLASYYNLRKELEGKRTAGMENEKIAEIISLLRTSTIYAVQIRRKNKANRDLPSETCEIVKWYQDRENEYKEKLKNSGIKFGYIDALFSLMVEKQNIAGLTANTYQDFGSKMDAIVEKIE